jgi:hypothetical protein
MRNIITVAALESTLGSIRDTETPIVIEDPTKGHLFAFRVEERYTEDGVVVVLMPQGEPYGSSLEVHQAVQDIEAIQ